MIAIAVFAALALGFWIAWTRALPKELLLLIPLLPIESGYGLEAVRPNASAPAARPG